jgi:hypothetical protein
MYIIYGILTSALMLCVLEMAIIGDKDTYKNCFFRKNNFEIVKFSVIGMVLSPNQFLVPQHGRNQGRGESRVFYVLNFGGGGGEGIPKYSKSF